MRERTDNRQPDGGIEKEWLLESILNDSNQMIQVSDLETYTMLYANSAARIYTGHENQPYQGEYCYKYMMGLDKPCPFCPMRKMEQNECQETEVDNGKEIYAVKTKVTEWNGKKVFIEYAWDITEVRRSQKIFETQMQTLLGAIPEAQGIFHLDITSDVCLSINGSSKSLDTMEHKTTVNDLVRQVAAFVPDEQGKEEFFTFFNRESLLNAYKKGKAEIKKETDSYFDDGSIRSACITARFFMNPSTDHLECVIYGMDITEEKKELLAYEKHMKEQFDIFNALSKDYLNIFLVDGDADTARILKLDGYVTTGLVNNPDRIYPYKATCEQYISERVHPDDQEMMHDAMKLERVLQELTVKKEYVSAYKTLVNGEVHYYQFKYMRLENTKHIIAGFQNIDALITREKEVQKKLELALRAEEQSNQAKRVFMNSMSHDIRTPLNAIVGYTTLASSHIEDKDAVKKYLSRITTAGSHLIALVNDVLEMNQIESGNIQMDDLPVYIPEVIEELETMIQASVSEKNLKLIVDAEEIVHKKILADKLRLNQVLLNILGNSVKFTKPGGSIYFKVKEIENAPKGYAGYCFEIKDTGIGMSREFSKHIFETFTREKTATVSGIQGSGLGMAIAKNIVDLLGGTIQVNSEVDKGTETTVFLQFKVCDSPEENKEDHDNIPDFSGKKILLVEDNELNREIAVEILQEAGFSVETAEDGTIAVERMHYADAGSYDLILMDIQMPKMDGYEATREIRKLNEPQKATIPIIAMTANAFAEDQQKAFDAGMDGYIAKPIDISKLMETLKGFLK
ncbi:response regulator [Blautia sp. MSJ-9]|uniref:response regulator n=1 Tax=Blautia sp. MSJ-9 TaxID=2841511 RepID=UPI001C100077|nr:response regulator [Blautia sp. MSJ-9]MBU5680706.1 response regulator [Blautia sp. MSJ-9]